VESWDLKHREWSPHRPEILYSTDDGRAIVLDIPAGEMLQDHQVHEGAWISVVYGEVTIDSRAGQTLDAEAGMVAHLSPQERHEVKAVTDSRVLLLLTPWPGPGHPGAMTLEQKSQARTHAAERAS
jgi:quercetin dioxygenase-like cupin family protein